MQTLYNMDVKDVKRKTCRMCGAHAFREVIDFGMNPLVNSLVEKQDLDKMEQVYPLVVEQCQWCFLVQIVNPVDSHQIYQAQDYLYFTGEMPTTDAYFADFANEIKEIFVKSPNDLVVEIGSNDGTMLKNFPRALGVDPSTNVVIRALARGIPTLSAGFTEQNAKNIAKEFGKAKVVGGANCIAHLHNLNDMMRGVKALLSDDGIFWVECNYWGAMVKNKNYALIYHDHFSYFTLRTWVEFLRAYDMDVFDAYVTPAQGGSLRIFACDKKISTPTERFFELLAEEDATRLNSYETAVQYEKNVRMEAQKLYELIVKLKAQGKKIAGYGAAAKGFSVLKLAGIDERHIDYFIDDSPAKQGKFTPISHIPVVPRGDAKPVDYFFITAPNYKDVIIEKEKAFVEEGGRFITTDGDTI